MTPPEEDIISTLRDCLLHWKKYVNDMCTHINPYNLGVIIKELNNYPKIHSVYI